MLNREVFATDPIDNPIPNGGVAKVDAPSDDKGWKVLEWELRSFVCEGEFNHGLDRIFSTYLSNVATDRTQQPAVWVSGFFGSGKSHLLRVLEYLWRDVELPSGARARDLVTLPSSISQHLVELTNAGKRAGGLWSAAGTLGAGKSSSVRLAFLEIILEAADLPSQYVPASLALMLMDEGIYEQVRASVEAQDKDLVHELNNLFVSKVLHAALIEAGASFGASPAEISKALQAQFKGKDDPSNDEVMDVLERVLKLKSTKGDAIPLTLIILDELQMFLGGDNDRAERVRELVEAVSTRFDRRVLFVAAGQSALTAGAVLGKLTDRFSVRVPLSDTDVQSVVRSVVLRKRPDAVPAIEASVDAVSGEISKHLGGTRIGAVAADGENLVTDYPLLPTRRRFWERAMRAIDAAGKEGTVRAQLRVVHDAAVAVSERPLGTVIGGDFLYERESPNMLQSGVLLKEIHERILTLDDKTADGTLKARVCQLIFLISQLPREGIGETGVTATPDFIADLLVEDLASDGPGLRKNVPRVLDELLEEGQIMKIGAEYRLQTEESAEWTADFNKRRNAINDDAGRMASLRTDLLKQAVEAVAAGIAPTQGRSKVVRRVVLHWTEDAPVSEAGSVPVWVQDEWQTSETKVRTAARDSGLDSPLIFILLPKTDAEALRDQVATFAAAKDVVEQRPEPQTEGGRQAKAAMANRQADAADRVQRIIEGIIDGAKVYQAGGTELAGGSLRASLLEASTTSLTRLFPKFTDADDPNWEKVVGAARDGDSEALQKVGWPGDVVAHPVCKEVLARTPVGGRTGSDLHKEFTASPFGWPKEAINGALLVLLANGNLRAVKEDKPIAGAKELPPTQVGVTTFFKEDDPPGVTERLAVRGLLNEAGIQFVVDRERESFGALLQHLLDLADRAGGPAPLPEAPDTTHVVQLQALSGNQQFRAIASASERLRSDRKVWAQAGDDRETRIAEWSRFQRLLEHGRDVAGIDSFVAQRDAILAGRTLLVDPDPLAPLLKDLAQLLRERAAEAWRAIDESLETGVAGLENDADWGRIDESDRTKILAGVGLVTVAAPDLATDEGLLAALDHTSISMLADRREAIAVKVANARVEAARLLAPKAVQITTPHRTVHSADELEAYLGELRALIKARLDAGEIVIL